MKIIIEIGHPAHVHNFKNMIRSLKGSGQETVICAMDKDVSLSLLDALGLDYEVLSENRSGNLINKALLLIKSEYRMLSIARQFKPDIFISRVSPISAHISRIIGKPHIGFTDTEHARLTNAIAVPFTDVICTPSCFKNDLGKKQVRYNGYKELAYLHPNYFKPDPSVLGMMDLTNSEKFVVVRFVSWGASHDIGQHGFSMEAKRSLIKKLEEYARVFITSEGPLPGEFERYRITTPPEKAHDLLYYAALYLGEGGTMATEAAVLGTPSVYISSLVGTMGNFIELEQKYDLLYAFQDPDAAIQKAVELIQQPDLKEKWAAKRKRLLSEKIDVTQFMVDFIENYPESFINYQKRKTED